LPLDSFSNPDGKLTVSGTLSLAVCEIKVHLHFYLIIILPRKTTQLTAFEYCLIHFALQNTSV
jgi:hypothetical protein